MEWCNGNGRCEACEGLVEVPSRVMLSEEARANVAFVMGELRRVGLYGVSPELVVELAVGASARAHAGRASYALVGGDA